MQRAIDGDNITLSQHLLEAFNTTAANLLLNLRRQGLVIKVKQLLAVKRLQAAQDTLANTTNSDSADDLVLEVELVLGNSSYIPVTALDLLVSRDEVANKSEDSHNHVLSDRDDVAASDLGNSNTTVGLVGSVQIDVI
jgi:hypothetical protein